MMQRPPTAGAILRINGWLLYATLVGAFAWWLWPTRAEDWGYGMTSIILGLAAISGVIEAIKTAVKLTARDKAIARYMAQGNKPKTAEMASADALRNAGMTDV